ncbi:MAG: transporter related protein [Clostridiales bacterium]|jgi:ABC-2 type transport system ATP-binding protein|nr:transporter related protein [Clostridiales bacterium]
MKIEINNLDKSYGSKQVLNNINMEISEGMFGLLGPNGAGKTTLMRILTTLLHKTGGSVRIDGIDIDDKSKIRPIIGYLPQDFSMYSNMSVYESLDYLAILSGINDDRITRKKRIINLLERVNLERQLRTKVRALSGGMKRRLGISQALLHNPKVLIVDEPTAGLDPEERVRFRNMLTDFAEGRIVILSTHIVEDIEFTCENLAILKEGQMVYQGRVKELIEKVKGSVWTSDVDREEFNRVKRNYNIISTVSEGERVRLRIISAEKPFENAFAIQPSIEDAYMKLIREVN